MKKVIKIILYCLFSIFINFSCSKKLLNKKDYPQIVIHEEGFYSIESCYTADIIDYNNVPEKIRIIIKKHLKNKLHQNYVEKVKFDYGFIHSNDKFPNEKRKMYGGVIYDDNIDKEQKINCDSTFNYPVYDISYNLDLSKKGIKKLAFNFTIDSKGKIIRNRGLPNIIDSTIIPIDSVNSILISRNISPEKLEIRLKYSQKKDALFWYTSTLIQQGSIVGPSCFPIINYHFKMNAITGELTDYNLENNDDYFEN